MAELSASVWCLHVDDPSRKLQNPKHAKSNEKKNDKKTEINKEEKNTYNYFQTAIVKLSHAVLTYVACMISVTTHNDN